jgi:hypothetical protein
MTFKQWFQELLGRESKLGDPMPYAVLIRTFRGRNPESSFPLLGWDFWFWMRLLLGSLSPSGVQETALFSALWPEAGELAAMETVPRHKNR